MEDGTGRDSEKDKSSQEIYLEVDPTGHSDSHVSIHVTAWDKPRVACCRQLSPWLDWIWAEDDNLLFIYQVLWVTPLS